jgi:exodeoxyribonuclease VII large subunit
LQQLSFTRQAFEQRLHNAMSKKLSASKHHFVTLSRALEAISPLATLGRGYAIVRKRDDGTIVRDAKLLKSGEILKTQLQYGSVLSTVTETRDS